MGREARPIGSAAQASKSGGGAPPPPANIVQARSRGGGYKSGHRAPPRTHSPHRSQPPIPSTPTHTSTHPAMARPHCLLLLALALLAATARAAPAVCEGAELSYVVDDGVIAGPDSENVEEAHGWAEALAQAVAERVGEHKGCKAIEKEVQRACRTVRRLRLGGAPGSCRPAAGGERRATAAPRAALASPSGASFCLPRLPLPTCRATCSPSRSPSASPAR